LTEAAAPSGVTEQRGARLALLLLALACTAFGLHTIHPIANPDFGWHVALGRWILENGAAPSTEPFTHTAFGRPMVAQAWASQVLYASTIDVVGVRGLRFANGALAAAILLVLYRWLRRAGAAPVLAVLLAVVWAVVAENRLQLRPHMFNLLFFVVAYGAVFIARPRLSPLQLSGLTLLGVCWINMHSGALLFAAIVALYAAVATFERVVLRRTRRTDEPGEGALGRLWATAGLLLCALLVSPNHARIFPYALETGRINAGLSLEWFSILSRQALATHGALELICLAALLGGALWFAFRRRNEVPLARLAVVVFVAALPLLSQRFTWTSLVPALFIAESLGGGRDATQTPAAAETSNAVRAASLALALGLIVSTFGDSMRPARVSRRATNLANFATGEFPTDAMTFLTQAELEGRLFNPNRWGGYVLFRTQERFPVFVDGRWITIGEQIVRDAHAVSTGGPRSKEILDRYGIEIVLVHRGWMADALRDDPSWRTAFENFNAGVYLRRGPSFEANLARCSAYYTKRSIPFDPATGFREREALDANPSWAGRMSVQRLQLHRVGRPATGVHAQWVPGWSE
jgi:hypothetical protein